MKTLLVLAASVLFLWGCQTTQSTAQSVPTQEVEKVVPKTEKKPKDEPVFEVMIQNKPVMCGKESTVMTGLMNPPAKEAPLGFWSHETTGHKTLLLANVETGTVTVLEFPTPGVVCMVSTGIGVQFPGFTLKEAHQKTRGQHIKY